MIGDWLFGGGTVEVRCDIDIEQTPDSFHAYAIPDGVDIRPGDVVTKRNQALDRGQADRGCSRGRKALFDARVPVAW